VAEKPATGGGGFTAMYPAFVSVSEPPELYAVRVTVYDPASAYSWLGFCSSEVPPSPKVHDQAVGVFVDRSVKSTSSGAVPEVGAAEKSAAGGGGGDAPTVM